LLFAPGMRLRHPSFSSPPSSPTSISFPPLRPLPPDPTIQLVDEPCFRPKLADLISEAIVGLENHPPELCEEGVNGTYFMKDKTGKVVAVFKPSDEEGNSVNNPKRTPRRNSSPKLVEADPSEQLQFEDLELDEPDCVPEKKGIRPGEAAQREVAAYMLDCFHGNFYGVPRTAMVNVKDHQQSFWTSNCCAGNADNTSAASTFAAALNCHGYNNAGTLKTGSFQEFVYNDGAAGDVGASVFPVDEVHKIGILDLQIFNTDRHEGNILFLRNNAGKVEQLIPIDHGFSLPDCLEGAWFDWLQWPQAKQPFSAKSLAFIEKLNVDENVELLEKELDIRHECLRTMKISSTLLKKGAAAGLTLYDIAKIVCRDAGDDEQLSQLEEMCDEAKADRRHQRGGSFGSGSDSDDIDDADDYLCCLWTVMDREIAKMRAHKLTTKC